ncbi:MAG: CBS domain-containing protein [Candidatus Zixiibacteriota bacterium]
MTAELVKDLMVPLSDYVIVSENDTVETALKTLRESHLKMPPDLYYHRAVLVKNDAGDIVGKVGYLGFLAALEPTIKNLDEMKALAGSGITSNDIGKDMRSLGFAKGPFPLIKKRASMTIMKDVMVEFCECIDEECSLIEAMHRMVSMNVLSLLTTKDRHITGIIRMSDLFEAITDFVVATSSEE